MKKSEDINFYVSIGFIKIDRYICRHCESQNWHGNMYLKHIGLIVVHFHHKIINNYCHRVKRDPFIFTAWPQDTALYSFESLISSESPTSSSNCQASLWSGVSTKIFLIEIMQSAVRSSLLMVLLDRNNVGSKSGTLFCFYDTQNIWNLEMGFELHHQIL